MQMQDRSETPYPWVYTPGLAAKAGLLILSALLAVVGAVLLGSLPSASRTMMETIVQTAIGGVLLLSAVYAALVAIRSATVLTADTIESREPPRTRTLRRTEIAGYRIRRHRHWFPTVKLQVRSSDLKGMTVTAYRADAAFDSWFEGLTDLDEQERAEAERILLADDSFGRDPEERRRTLARLRHVATAASVVGGAIMLWNVLWPHPYLLALAVSAIAPIAAIMLRQLSGGRFVIFAKADDGRPTLAGLLLAGLGLAFRAAIDVHVYHWIDALWPALLAGAVFMAVIAAADGPITALRRAGLASLAFVAVAYGGGAVLQVDWLMDRSAAQIVHTDVLRKHVSRGKATVYYVTLSPWGDRPQPEEIRVDRRLFTSLDKDSPACVSLFPGALRIRWFTIAPCQPDIGTRRTASMVEPT